MEGPLLILLVANLLYLLGPATEALVARTLGRHRPSVGPALYRIGLTFSVGLALLPALLILIIWLVRVLAVAVG